METLVCYLSKIFMKAPYAVVLSLKRTSEIGGLRFQPRLLNEEHY